MILLTRPHKDSKKMAEILGVKNCIIEPMIEINKLDTDLTEHINNNPQAIVKTSNNAPDINIWPITITIPENGKNAQEILDYCKTQFSPKGGKIIYLSGDPISLDIAEELNNAGFDAQRVITYKQIPSVEFGESFLSNLSSIRTATFFSLETFNVFAGLIEKRNLQESIGHISCIALSRKIADEVAKLGWADVDCCSQPNQDSMIRRIRNPLLDS